VLIWNLSCFRRRLCDGFKNSAITAIVLIESLVHLLKNENVDISTVKITIGNKKDGIESPEIQLQQLIDISLKELLEIKNGEKS
jgi:hypothetical protein